MGRTAETTKGRIFNHGWDRIITDGKRRRSLIDETDTRKRRYTSFSNFQEFQVSRFSRRGRDLGGLKLGEFVGGVEPEF
jgi:hypothetical protein